MKALKILAILAVITAFAASTKASDISVTLSSPGTLEEEIAKQTNWRDVTGLKVSGHINGDDIYFIRQMAQGKTQYFNFEAELVNSEYMNDLAPEICFGFEGIPGHQRSKDRGEYAPRNNTYGTYTYGGAGLMVAKVGGLWDALLSEGRRWWLFTCSDFHNLRSDFLPGEYNKTYLFLPDTIEPMRLADYLRTGNCFVVGGNFIAGARVNLNGACMGQTLEAQAGEALQLEIAVTENTASPLRVDHIDLIAGEVHPKAAPGTEAYRCDSVQTTKVIARFTEKDWKRDSDGTIRIQYAVKPSSDYTYYRLRGTHLVPGTPGETDAAGNPLPDAGLNTEEKAMNDQWFYTNPIFCKIKK